MTAPALAQTLFEAVYAILSADATIATLCGGTAHVVARRTIGPGIAIPALAFEVRETSPGSGRADLLLSAVAMDPAGHGQASDLLDAARAALTATAFQAQGVAAVPFDGTVTNIDEVGDLRDLTGTPTLEQADWSLPLLVLD